MTTENKSIDKVLSENTTSFFIPPFQRAYAWGRPEIERYFNDMMRIIDSHLDNSQHNKLEHFFGTLVIKLEQEGFASKSVVVDGQQRLTTTLIFLIALRDLQENRGEKDRITNRYLINVDSTYEDKIKLKQVSKDWEAYKALINNNTPEPGIIKNAYDIFCKLINDKKKTNPEIELLHYITAIQRMNVAVIFLDERPFKGEDPQIIFETLNSLGKPLTLSDLVRNFILLNMNSNNQSNIYENIWYPKIESVLMDNTSDFFRDYLQYKTSSSIKTVSDNNTKEIYHLFKKYVEDNFANRNDFIDSIVQFVAWYKWIVIDIHSDIVSSNSENNSLIKELLRNIFHDIKAEAFKPFVLGLLEYHQKGVNGIKLSDEILISILELIRTYLIRRRIMGLSRGENKNIVSSCKRIGELAQGSITMIDLLTNMFYLMRFPNDEEIRKELSSMNFYDGLKRYSKLILGKIEEHNSKVSVDFRNPKITIEHIMPQTLTEDWENELGQDYKNIHNNYLHNIGNLILTEFNSEIGNKPFSDKKRKLDTSTLSFRLNITNKATWNEDSILDHQDKMIAWFLDAFPLPTEYRNTSNWNAKIVERTSFSPLDDFTSDIAEGNKPKELHINNEVYKAPSWQDVFIMFVKYFKDNQENYFNFILDNQTELFAKPNTILKWSSLKTLIDNNTNIKEKYKNFNSKRCDNIPNLTNDEYFLHINIKSAVCITRISNIMNKLNMDKNSVEIIILDSTSQPSLLE